MAVNDLTFNQASTVLNSIVKQATGQTVQTPTNTAEFVTVAQLALKAGYDPVLNAISQVLSRTIFSIRPYNRKFAGLQVDEQKFGNITRKLNIADKDWDDDARFTLVDGQSVDMFRVNKPNVLQTNFYGANVYERSYTIFRDQLDNAFRSPEEFSRFVTMVVQNCSDMIEQAHENMARATIANFIGGKYAAQNGVIHLLTEYNTLTGLSLTAQSVYDPANYKAFMQWAYARIAAISALMTERSIEYQINITGKEISRHTPYAMQKVFLYTPAAFQIESRVLADTYHDNYLRYAYNERVNFWQSIKTPDSLQVIPTYLGTDGALVTAENAVSVSQLFGCIIDEEAAGYTVVNTWSAPTPFNAKGGYSNVFFHFTDRFWNDFTEKGVILLLN